MGKKLIIYLLFFLVMLFTRKAYSSVNETVVFKRQVADTTRKIKDGNYEGRSQASYTDEPYWGIVKLTVKEGVFSEVKFIIRDSALHEYFDGKYEKHFEGNPVYVEQSRNDWKGVQTYPGKLTGKKSIKNVDAMSGATWSYKIFKASVEDALKNAE